MDIAFHNIQATILRQKIFWPFFKGFKLLITFVPRLLNYFATNPLNLPTLRSSCSEVFLGKGVLKICSKSTGEYLCRGVISINLLSNFIEIALRNGCSPVNLLYIFRTPIPKNTSGWLLLYFHFKISPFNMTH